MSEVDYFLVLSIMPFLVLMFSFSLNCLVCHPKMCVLWSGLYAWWLSRWFWKYVLGLPLWNLLTKAKGADWLWLYLFKTHVLKLLILYCMEKYTLWHTIGHTLHTSIIQLHLPLCWQLLIRATPLSLSSFIVKQSGFNYLSRCTGALWLKCVGLMDIQSRKREMCVILQFSHANTS